MFYAGRGVLGAFAFLKFMRSADPPPPSALWLSATACRILPEGRCNVLCTFNVIFYTDMKSRKDFLLRPQPLTQQHIRARARAAAGD